MQEAQLPTTQPVQTPEKIDNSMKKGTLSFISLFLIGVTTVLAVLLVNEKLSATSTQLVETTPVTQPEMTQYQKPTMKPIREVIELPEPRLDSQVSLEESIQNRRSRRFYSEEPVTQQELSQILWSAQGETDESGHRAAPSARSAYPFSLYVVIRNVVDIAPGLYLYNPSNHTLGNLGLANAGELLIGAGVQDNSQKAPVVITLAAAPAAMLAVSPSADPMPSIYLEGGHIGQNVYLQVESLQMATVVSGGFDKMAVAQALGLDTANEVVVYLIPFGHIGVDPTLEPAN